MVFPVVLVFISIPNILTNKRARTGKITEFSPMGRSRRDQIKNLKVRVWENCLTQLLIDGVGFFFVVVVVIVLKMHRKQGL